MITVDNRDKDGDVKPVKKKLGTKKEQCYAQESFKNSIKNASWGMNRSAV